MCVATCLWHLCTIVAFHKFSNRLWSSHYSALIHHVWMNNACLYTVYPHKMSLPVSLFFLNIIIKQLFQMWFYSYPPINRNSTTYNNSTTVQLHTYYSYLTLVVLTGTHHIPSGACKQSSHWNKSSNISTRATKQYKNYGLNSMQLVYYSTLGQNYFWASFAIIGGGEKSRWTWWNRKL